MQTLFKRRSSLDVTASNDQAHSDIHAGRRSSSRGTTVALSIKHEVIATTPAAHASVHAAHEVYYVCGRPFIAPSLGEHCRAPWARQSLMILHADRSYACAFGLPRRRNARWPTCFNARCRTHHATFPRRAIDAARHTAPEPLEGSQRLRPHARGDT